MKRVKDGIVTETLDDYISSSLEHLIDEAIANLQKEKEKYQGKYTNLTLDSVPNSYEDGYHLVLLGDRPATPAEQEAQDAAEAQQKAQREKWDKEQLARLKAQYEK